MSRSPDEMSFAIQWQREREHVCWTTAQEIVSQGGDTWPLVGFYAGEIANSADDFLFVSTRLAYWTEHFLAVKRPELGKVSNMARFA